MDDERDPGDVFAIPDLWGLSRCVDDVVQPNSLFSDLKLPVIDFKLPDVADQCQHDELFFGIPELPIGPAEQIISPSQSDEPLGDTSCNEPEQEPLQEPVNYQTWDSFTIEQFNEPQTAYLTEAGARVFDTALAAQDDFLNAGNTLHHVVDSKIFATSVLALGLGRNSMFFAWDTEKRSFSATLQKVRVSGHTAQSLDGFLAPFMSAEILPSFFKTLSKRPIYQTSHQSQLNVRASDYESILQLQALIQPVHSVLTCFKRLVTKTLPKKSDEAILSTLFEEIQLLEHRTDSLRDILLEILSRVSIPWLEFTGEWLGLKREDGVPLAKDGPGKSFVKVDNKEWVDEAGLELNEPDFILDLENVPSFMPLEDARIMFEVGRSLRILRTHHIEHPLSKMEVVESVAPPALEWRYSWQDILDVETKALKYEQDLTAALRNFSGNHLTTEPTTTGSRYELYNFDLDFFGRPEEEIHTRVVASINRLDSKLKEPLTPVRFKRLLQDCLSSAPEPSQVDESIFSPPISLAPLLSFNPIISAQARVVNSVCMQLFFKSHKLRDHLSLQRDFHLLGNGVFSSRLSHALFDPELESAERQKGVALSGGTMGLRLGGRDTWPPASSELRLALMGVLTESYASYQPENISSIDSYLQRQKSLPGDLSFAVRDMSEEEIKRCMDPNSIEALDFLRLSYKPPAPLESILTPIILYKYDQLFKQLLRTLRMLYVVSALFRDATDRTSSWQNIHPSAHKFRIEAHHFISARKLDEIEERMDSGNFSLGQNEGLESLRDYHERVLDKMLFALFLRKRQKPVMQLLEEIFGLILRFSKHSREKASGAKAKTGNVGEDENIKVMYGKFRKRVGVFITVCRGLTEKKGYGEKTFDVKAGSGGLFDAADLAEENTVGQLVLRLEMSGYYMKGV
ncbi:spc97 spc98 family protein [Botrytis cinerea]